MDKLNSDVTRPRGPVVIDIESITKDYVMGEEIMALLEDLYSRGNTIILVTHERDIARHARRTVHLRDGIIESDEVDVIPAMEAIAAS